MNQFWLIWQTLTKSTDWLRAGQGKATNGSCKNCFHLGCIQKITFRVAQNARNSQKWRWAIEHIYYQQGITRRWRREKEDVPTYSCGHHQNQWMLRTPPPPPWPSTLRSPTLSFSPSLHLEYSHSLTHPHFSLTLFFHSTFHLAPQEPPSRWQTFLKPLTSEQSFSLSPRSQTVANVARPTKRRSQLVAERDGEQLASSGSDRRRSHSLLLRMIFCFPYRYNISGQIHSFMSNESPKDCENMTHL